jgi:hypothetical protein
VLRFLGFTLTQIREGFNTKGVPSPTGKARMRPHHRDVLYNDLKAVEIPSLARFRRAHLHALAVHGLLSGGVYAIDGTGMRNKDMHIVILQQAGTAPPFIANWRVQGPGQELAAGREMVAELCAELGPEAIKWLLLDGAYIDGAWLAELQQQGIGAMVRVRADMQIFEQMLQLTRFPEFGFEPYEYLRVIQGHKELHTVELALITDITLWSSYRQAWQRQDDGGQAAFECWRSRWDVENQGFRELNQGGWLESQTWGRSPTAIQTSIALKIGAHNCYCLMRMDLGAEWAVTGLRDLQRHLWDAPPQIMVMVEDSYALLTPEELVLALGGEVHELLDPSLAESPL